MSGMFFGCFRNQTIEELIESKIYSLKQRSNDNDFKNLFDNLISNFYPYQFNDFEKSIRVLLSVIDDRNNYDKKIRYNIAKGIIYLYDCLDSKYIYEQERTFFGKNEVFSSRNALDNYCQALIKINQLSKADTLFLFDPDKSPMRGSYDERDHDLVIKYINRIKTTNDIPIDISPERGNAFNDFLDQNTANKKAVYDSVCRLLKIRQNSISESRLTT